MHIWTFWKDADPKRAWVLCHLGPSSHAGRIKITLAGPWWGRHQGEIPVS